MDKELSTQITDILAKQLGDGWLKALFTATAIYLVYPPGNMVDTTDASTETMYEVSWAISEAEELLLGEPKEVSLEYVEKRMADEFGTEMTAPIVMKSADEQRIVYGPVLVPDELDSDGEKVTKAKIEEVAHNFLRDYGNMDLQHGLNNVATPVESYLMPVDVNLPGPDGDVGIPAGTWMMAAYVEDENTWQAVKDGKLTGFSVMGVRKTEAEALKSADVAVKKVLLRDLGDDWMATHVSLVAAPAVPKAEWLVIKSSEKDVKPRGFIARLFARKEPETQEEIEMDKAELVEAFKEALTPIEEKLEALKTEETPPEEKPAEKDKEEKTPEAAAEKKEEKKPADEEAPTLEEAIKSLEDFKAEIETRFEERVPRVTRKAAVGQDDDGDDAATADKSYGDRDVHGRSTKTRK